MWPRTMVLRKPNFRLRMGRSAARTRRRVTTRSQRGRLGGLPHSSRTNFWWDRLSHDVAARSRHPGGVNGLLCDGSVRFVRQAITIRTLAALVTRNAGETNIDE